jgi:catechol 2,3-dioxygenase-like lactoylglutathione lyase family enzyme
MHLKKLNQIILFVQDMHETAMFYRDKLGLKLLYPTDIDDFAGERWAIFDTGSCQLALHSGGKRRLGDDSPKLVFRVDDLEEARRELLSMGVSLSEIRPIQSGLSICNGVDPEGNRFSLESQD